MILKILLAANFSLLLLFLIFMVGMALSPKMRAEQADYSLKGRKDYYIPRKLLMVLLPWMFIGVLPRVAGGAAAKPQFAKVLYFADILILATILGCLLWSIYCIFYNAHLRMKNASRTS